MSDIIIKFGTNGSEKDVIEAIGKIKRSTEGLTGETKKNTGETDKNTRGKKKNKDETLKLVNHNRLLNNSFATMRSNLLLLNFAMGLGVRQLIHFGEQAAQLQSMERAFNTLSGGTDNASIALEKLQEATNGTMSDFDLFQQANNAMILGVTRNADEMAKLFDMAQRLGRAMGRDTRSSVESLMIGIGRQSRMMLDNVGIIVKAEDAYKKYAQANNLSATALNQNQKQQAFMNAVLDAATTALADLPEEVLTAQDAYDRLSASTANFTAETGEVINRALLPLIISTTEFINALDDEDIRVFMESVISLGSVLVAVKLRTAAYVAIVKLIPLATAAATMNLATFTAALSAAAGPLMLATALIGGGTFALLRYSGVFEKTEEEAIQLNRAVEKLGNTIEEVDPSGATKKLDDFYRKLAEGNNLLSMTIKTYDEDLIDAILKFADDTKDIYSGKVLGSLEDFIDGLQNTLGVSDEFFDKFIRGSELLSSVTNGTIQTEEELLAVVKAMVDQNSKLNAELIKEIVSKERLKATNKGLADTEKFRFGSSEGLTDELLRQQEVGEELIKLGQRTIEGEMMHIQSLILEAEALKLTTDFTYLKQLGLDALIQKYEELEAKVVGSNDEMKKSELSVGEAYNMVANSVGNAAVAFGASEKEVANLEATMAMIRAIGAGLRVLDSTLMTTNPPLAIATAATVVAAGVGEAIKIRQLANQVSGSGTGGAVYGSFEQGGYVGGNRHSQGGTIIEAERGEFVMSRRAVESIGLETLNQMNQGGGGASINVSVTGNVMTQDFVEGELAESIKEAVRRGSDFGIG